MIDIKSFTGLIVTGCSFSVGTSDINLAKQCPSTWAHFLLQRNSNFRQFVNLAMSGGGNLASSSNLQIFLEQEDYRPDNNLVLFNITGTDRYDMMCEIGHSDANETCSWNHVLNIDWITTGGFARPKNSFIRDLQKNMGYGSIKKMNYLAIISMIHYLEIQNYRYAFMIMKDDCVNDSQRDTTPDWFNNFLGERNNLLIKFEGKNMHEFCKEHDMLSDDNFHPSVEGYRVISEHIEEHLKSL